MFGEIDTSLFRNDIDTTSYTSQYYIQLDTDTVDWRTTVDAVKIGYRERTAAGRVTSYSFTDSDVKIARFDAKRRITMVP
jgi:hypothetical protein